MLPILIEKYEKDTKFYDPFTGSFLACITMIASATTFTNASVKHAVVSAITTPNTLTSGFI